MGVKIVHIDVDVSGAIDDNNGAIFIFLSFFHFVISSISVNHQFTNVLNYTLLPIVIISNSDY